MTTTTIPNADITLTPAETSEIEAKALRAAALTDTELTVRCAPWSGEPLSSHRVWIVDGNVLVWDPVAGHYTSCHSLTSRSIRRILAVAKRRSAEVPPRTSHEAGA